MINLGRVNATYDQPAPDEVTVNAAVWQKMAAAGGFSSVRRPKITMTVNVVNGRTNVFDIFACYINTLF
jgi:hypothetical protein